MGRSKIPKTMRETIEISRPWLSDGERERLVAFMSKEYIHQAVALAIQTGILRKRTVCSTCGRSPQTGTAKRIVAHHDDYSQPLNVRWLCTKCHADWHRMNKPLYLPSILLGLSKLEYLEIGVRQLLADAEARASPPAPFATGSPGRGRSGR